MNRQRLIAHLEQHEDRIPYAYQDSEGYWTIGVGHLIDKRLNGRLSDDVIDLILREDIDAVLAEAHSFPWFLDLDDVRQEVVVEMLFNLGLERFSGFKLMIAALARHDYEDAAREALDSKWAGQVGQRALRLSEALRTGEWA